MRRNEVWTRCELVVYLLLQSKQLYLSMPSLESLQATDEGSPV